MKYAMFLPGGPLPLLVDWAKKIEGAGFDSLWQGELVNSALIPLAAVAPAVKKIKLGTGISLAFAHSPVMLALAALDLDLLSDGRFTLGLGVAHPNRNNNWYAGRDDGKPLSQLREYVAVVRLIMEKAPAGGEVSFEGEHYRIRARRFFPRMIRQPREQVPVYIAAVQRRMAALAGEVADGLIGNPLFSPGHLRQVVAPSVQAGLSRAGRKRTELEILGQCFAVIEEDRAAAYRIGAGALLFSIWARVYDGVFGDHGFGRVVAQVREAQQAGAGVNPVELIPNDMVDAFCAVGPVDRVRVKVREREGLLDTVILAVPSTGTSPEQQDYYRNKILDAFAT